MPVTHFDLALRRPLAQGRPFGDVGPYEELKGRLRFAVDPTHPSNTRITDVGLAPRNREGRVEFAADVSILAPVDPARGSGRVILDVVNRGNTVTVPNFNHATRPVFGAGADPNPAIDVGDGFLMRRGWIVVSCGWQCDVPEIGGLFRLHAPPAMENGRPVQGRIYVNLQAPEPVPHFLLSDRGHLAHPAADLGERDAVLLVRDQLDGPPQTIPRARWRFARAVDGRVVDDPRHVWLEGGFEKGRLYQVAYTAIGAPVLGLSFAALRDCVAWLKHEPTSPAAGHARWAYAYGRSQTGRFLRTLVHFDLNVDEQGREALDGIIANVAGGMRGEFNQRFGQNSKDRPQMMAQVFPSTDTPTLDAGAGGVTGALHARLEARGSRLKVFYTNTSAEYHRGDASLVHTDPDGRRDVAHGPHTRVYHFTGTEHGVGIWPPTDTTPVAADPSGWTERSQNVRNVINYSRLLRACLLNLDRWVTEGVEPPPSRHPRLDDGTAVPPEALAKTFDRIPGAHYPRHHARAGRRDFGGDAEQRVLTRMPPLEGAPYGTRVSAVDDDGNEVAGIAVPEIRVPLAAYTGWSLRHPDIGGAEQLLYFAGATLPFAKTAAERVASGDPRPSIAERYASRADYLERVRKAALELVAARYLPEEDVELSVTFAARTWDWLAGA
ncbi:MAG TPA: alpha/beta hydrolase domain-containing protein [Candidatus Binatia bacterium]|nr:alpha/beta hydrolase domain-containing protein [Candidatus Binatia bacterium]